MSLGPCAATRQCTSYFMVRGGQPGDHRWPRGTARDMHQGALRGREETWAGGREEPTALCLCVWEAQGQPVPTLNGVHLPAFVTGPVFVTTAGLQPDRHWPPLCTRLCLHTGPPSRAVRETQGRQAGSCCWSHGRQLRATADTWTGGGCSHGRGRWGAAGGPPRVRWDEAGCLRNACDGPHFAGEKIMRK